MPLESLGQKDGKLNIKNIETPTIEPGNERPFDVEAEMPPVVWDKIKDFCEGETSAEYLKNPSEREKFRRMLEEERIDTVIDLIQVFPKRRDELKYAIEKARTYVTLWLALSKNNRELLSECSGWKNDAFDYFFNNCYRAVLLSPEQPKIDDADVALLVKYVRATMTPGNWGDFLRLMTMLAVIAPKEAETLKNEEAVFENCLKAARHSLRMRIIFPDIIPRKAIEKILGIAPEFEEGLVENLHTYLPYITKNNMKDMGDEHNQVGAQKAPASYVSRLLLLRILTSPSLRVTSRGLIFEDEPLTDFKHEVPPLPELKK